MRVVVLCVKERILTTHTVPQKAILHKSPEMTGIACSFEGHCISPLIVPQSDPRSQRVMKRWFQTY